MGRPRIGVTFSGRRSFVGLQTVAEAWVEITVGPRAGEVGGNVVCSVAASVLVRTVPGTAEGSMGIPLVYPVIYKREWSLIFILSGVFLVGVPAAGTRLGANGSGPNVG